jgi:hypothetical protein
VKDGIPGKGHIAQDHPSKGYRTFCDKSVRGWEVQLEQKGDKLKEVKNYIPGVKLCRECQAGLAVELTGVSKIIDEWDIPLEEEEDEEGDYWEQGSYDL